LGTDPSGAVIAGRVNFLIGWRLLPPVNTRRNLMAAKKTLPEAEKQPEPAPEPVQVTLKKSTCVVTVPEPVAESYEKQGFERVG
jgi:hypothetical protein